MCHTRFHARAPPQVLARHFPKGGQQQRVGGRYHCALGNVGVVAIISLLPVIVRVLAGATAVVMRIVPSVLFDVRHFVVGLREGSSRRQARDLSRYQLENLLHLFFFVLMKIN